MKKIILLTVFTLIVNVGLVFAQSRSMAVMPFDVIGNAVTADEAEAITELYISALVESGRVRIVDRANFDKLLRELNFQTSDWSNSKKTAKLGQALNAKFISRGKIMKLGSKLSISATVIDIQTAENIASTKGSYKDIDDLVNYFFLGRDSWAYSWSGKLDDMMKDVLYSKGPAGGLIFHFDGQYFYEAVFFPGEYSWNDARKRTHEVGGFTDWRLPNSNDVIHIYNNLIESGKHDGIKGAYWMEDENRWAGLDPRYIYRLMDVKYGENLRSSFFWLCLVRKFTDN